MEVKGYDIGVLSFLKAIYVEKIQNACREGWKHAGRALQAFKSIDLIKLHSLRRPIVFCLLRRS